MIFLPSLSEQSKIANFLDHETAKIDALIEKQQRLIELLKEKRQAVISHAVTKGLNPKAPMKDSGVEWLGEVPAHWGVTQLKYATSMIVDCPHETPTYSEDGQYLVIRTADLDEGRLDSSKMYRVDIDDYILRIRRAALCNGDIVYSREGERWGHAGLVPEDRRYCLGQRMMQFRANSFYCPDYLMWLLNTDNVYKQGQVDTVGATSPHVNVETIRNFSLTQPCLSEQQEISQFLNEKTYRLDVLVDKARNTVLLLQERRTALISAAVTGKIDVRDWQPVAA
jgi:type I restriction enzyme S subunit